MSSFWSFAFGGVAGYLVGRVIFQKKEEVVPVMDVVDPVPVESDYRAILFVRKDLKMRIGKIAAQCGHASLGLFLKVSKHMPDIAESWKINFPHSIYYIDNEEEMIQKEEMSREIDLHTVTIHDAGRTQIAAGSVTVLAVGPVHKEIESGLVDIRSLIK